MNHRLEWCLDRNWLLAGARNPRDLATQVFAGVLHSLGAGRIDPPGYGPGLDSAGCLDLLQRYFPLVALPVHASLCSVAGNAGRRSEFDELVQLLLEYRADGSEQTRWVAHAVASGCLGSDHLYADMGLSQRSQLSQLLREHFPALCLKNPDSAMKWKRFFYRQLCLGAEISLCPAPGCQTCVDRQDCFVSACADGTIDAQAD